MMSLHEAIRYFGVESVQEVEDLCLDFDLDVEVDDEGQVVGINPDDAPRALFGLHERTVGHRPDEPERLAKELNAAKLKERKEAEERKKRRGLLKQRIASRPLRV